MEAEEAKERGISDMGDLEREEPGMAEAVQDFFRLYKVLYCVFYDQCLHNNSLKKHLMYVFCQVPSGKGENNFAFDGEVQDKQFAKEVPV